APASRSAFLEREHEGALQPQGRQERGELLEDLALLEPLVDRPVFLALRLVVGEVDILVLEFGRDLCRGGLGCERRPAHEGGGRGGGPEAPHRLDPPLWARAGATAGPP